MKKICKVCGEKFYVRPSHAEKRVHCSMDCMSTTYKSDFKGKNNPNYKSKGLRNCINCGSEYHSYNKKRKYCSLECYRSLKFSDGEWKNFKDANHDEIVLSLKKMGCLVLDCYNIGNGFPDLIVNYKGFNYLLEIKNPNSYYGLSASQKRFHKEWQGQIDVVETINDIKEIFNRYENRN